MGQSVDIDRAGLPPGARRELDLALHELHQRAGKHRIRNLVAEAAAYFAKNPR